jgi:hypothetical protein
MSTECKWPNPTRQRDIDARRIGEPARDAADAEYAG